MNKEFVVTGSNLIVNNDGEMVVFNNTSENFEICQLENDIARLQKIREEKIGELDKRKGIREVFNAFSISIPLAMLVVGIDFVISNYFNSLCTLILAGGTIISNVMQFLASKKVKTTIKQLETLDGMIEKAELDLSERKNAITEAKIIDDSEVRHEQFQDGTYVNLSNVYLKLIELYAKDKKKIREYYQKGKLTSYLNLEGYSGVFCKFMEQLIKDDMEVEIQQKRGRVRKIGSRKINPNGE